MKRALSEDPRYSQDMTQSSGAAENSKKNHSKSKKGKGKKVTFMPSIRVYCQPATHT
jgi:hypothetical protein